MGENRSVQTTEFKKNSIISKLTNLLLKSSILPFCDKKNQLIYREQFNEASRSIEIIVDNILNFNIKHTPILLYCITNGLISYHGTQSKIKTKKKFLVYTQYDHKIPFVPEEDVMYTYLLSQLAYIGKQASEVLSKKEIKQLTDCVIDLNNSAKEIFLDVPTTMPRFYNHNRINLKAIQLLDKQVNCCPSLHIGFSLLFDNISEKILNGKIEDNSFFESIRYSTKRMFNSVANVKQHSIIDIAGGTLLAKIIFERNFEEDFNDLTSEYPEMQKINHHFNYNILNEMYNEILDLYYYTKDFSKTFLFYLKDKGYPEMFPEDKINNCYFNTITRKIERF